MVRRPAAPYPDAIGLVDLVVLVDLVDFVDDRPNRRTAKPIADARAAALDVTLVVPPNTTATLELPGRRPAEFPAGTHRVKAKTAARSGAPRP